MVTLYTAVGRFEKQKDREGRFYPAVIMCGKEYLLSIPEMVVWTLLNWRILELPKIEEMYAAKTIGFKNSESGPLSMTVTRLLQRGLIVDGIGDTGGDALHDLLGSLRILPLVCGLPAKILTFLKLFLVRRLPFRKAARVFRKESLTPSEKQVMSLAVQNSLSTAEVMKCVEYGVADVSSDAKLMEALYADEVTTGENLPQYARLFTRRQEVLSAVANLYLRQLILFESI